MCECATHVLSKLTLHGQLKRSRSAVYTLQASNMPQSLVSVRYFLNATYLFVQAEELDYNLRLQALEVQNKTFKAEGSNNGFETKRERLKVVYDLLKRAPKYSDMC